MIHIDLSRCWAAVWRLDHGGGRFQSTCRNPANPDDPLGLCGWCGPVVRAARSTAERRTVVDVGGETAA